MHRELLDEVCALVDIDLHHAQPVALLARDVRHEALHPA